MSTIRDESTRTLAEALVEDRSLRSLSNRVGRLNRVWYERMAAELLAASPTLAADLDLGTAWRMAQAALPEGYAGPVLYPRLPDLWHATAADMRFAVALRADDLSATGPTPTEALVALAAALRERAR